MTPQRITLITLGVADLASARAFYARLGWQEHGESQPGIAFFQLYGQALALFGRDAPAPPSARAPSPCARTSPQRPRLTPPSPPPSP
jgi:catechol 2,3-dioxygenase-like lactoylglutathione lyase family enzyme